MSEINSVNVYSVDEERLKYRVIAGIEANPDGIADNPYGQGVYSVNFPIPTVFANSSEYSQCLIKCDLFSGQTDAALNDPTWVGRLAGIGQLVKTPVVEIRLDVPSSQTTTISVASVVAQDQNGQHQVGGFRQLLPLQIVNVGDTNGATASPSGYAWTGIGSGISATDPILCANPFGNTVTISLRDVAKQMPIWLSSNALVTAGFLSDVGEYFFQFTVTMIPNNRSED